MKREEIKARLKESVVNEIPDIYSRINLKNIDIEPRRKKRFSFNFNQVFKVLLTSIVLFVTSFFVYNLALAPSNTTNTPLENDIQLIGFQTISAATILDKTIVEDLSAQEMIYIQSLSSTETDVENYFTDINPFLSMMETIINTDNNINYNEVDSDNPNYQKKIIYSSFDLAKNPLNFMIYYNQVDTSLTGIIMIRERTYNFTKTNENTQIYLDNENYISVTNDSSENQQKFIYRLYKDNSLLLQNTLEVFRVQRSIRARTIINKNGLSINLLVQRNEKNNLDELEIEYEIADNQKNLSGNFRVNLEMLPNSSEYAYRYILPEKDVNMPRGNMGNNSNNPHNTEDNDSTTTTQDNPGRKF